jgi:hypothetical protein
MYPLLRPGCFVKIDNRVRRMQHTEWRTEFDRPIYFMELRDSYICSWCEPRGSRLMVIPHPLSGCPVQQFQYPDEVEIIGQVTGVAMRPVSVQSDDRPNALPQLPKQP